MPSNLESVEALDSFIDHAYGKHKVLFFTSSQSNDHQHLPALLKLLSAKFKRRIMIGQVNMDD